MTNALPARATREAFGETLVELAQAGLDVVAVDADLAGSTTTKKLGAYDPARLVDVGIAESDMIGVAAGLSLTGRIPFTGSFAVFGTGRCYDQIRNTVCYGKLNVKVCPTHAGLSVGPDGGSHQMLEDIALMNALPNMRVLVPADYESARAAIRLSAAIEGPVYVRMGRAKVPQVYEPGFEMVLGGSRVLREGTDVTLIACGIEVDQALKAAEKLAEQGVSAEVIDAYSVKPLDEKTVLASAAKTGRVVTCEEHSINGGLGSIVASVLARNNPCPMRMIGTQDVFGTSGELAELLVKYGCDDNAIVAAAKELLA
ncbi:MAG: transketolase family protein [Coriobacteriaceae bacterium]|nr:transketolase family protein [Coriobacteriaceae bacterium]MDD7111281.1 transketolase family protein [Coriobacteriaceae bacterium]MDY5808804.1 transketolase family protein [Coriobacteriales bacterium]